MNKKITTGLFIAGTTCEKAAWYKRAGISGDYSEETLALFEQSEEVKAVAFDLFWPKAWRGYDMLIAEHFVNKGLAVVKAAFETDDTAVVVDALAPDANVPGCWNLYLISASAKINNQHINELAFQLQTVERCGIKIHNVFLLHINTSCVWPDKSSLFVECDVTNQVRGRIEWVDYHKPRLAEVLHLQEPPKCAIGKHCKRPLACPFQRKCWSLGKVSIWDIPRLSSKREAELLSKGVLYIEDVDLGELKLTDKQNEFIRVHLNKTEVMDKESILSEISGWKWPLVFIDFESDNNAIPKFNGARPYQQIPFQYSIHVLHDDGDLDVYRYLHKNKNDPRPMLAKRLVDDLERIGPGSLVAYYAAFERMILQDLATFYPLLDLSLRQASDNLVDLWDVVRKYVTNFKFEGKTSIKKVLPALVPDLTYDNLTVKNGSQAQHHWRSLISLPDGRDKDLAIQDAIDYCTMDTYAMVEIFEKLRN